MTGSGEKHAQDKNLIWCILVALRPILLLTVYINTLYVNPEILVLISDNWQYKSTNTTVKKKNQIPSLSMLELI